MQGIARSDACRTIMICIDSYEQGVPKGKFYNLGHEDDSCAFCSLSQLLIGIERKLDAASFPQAFTAMRTFAPQTESYQNSPSESKAQKGSLATFAVKILFRQNTSWQGEIVWLEGGGQQIFRSVLELILLIDSALGGSQPE